MERNCACATEYDPLPPVTTLDLPHLAQLQSMGQSQLAKSFAPARSAKVAAAPLAIAAPPPGTTGQLHTVADGGVLFSTGHASDNEGYLVLTGVIGPFPYEIHLSVALEGTTVAVTIELKKPIPLGPYTWKFALGGAVTGSNGELVAATSVSPVDLVIPAAAAASLALDWGCVLRCGGTAILGILLKCLPSLTGGPSSYIACVTASAGGGAAAIAACIAQKCVG
jgi:hypothetical protein